MYQSAFTYRPRTVRFCQWSRKAYAAFASLKIQVTMGCVSKGITEVALSKNGYTANSLPCRETLASCHRKKPHGLQERKCPRFLPASAFRNGKFILLRPLPVLDFRDLFLSFVLLYCP